MTTSSVGAGMAAASGSSAGFVGDDPITFYNSVFRRFLLPEGVLVPLLRTAEFELHGAAGRIQGQDQWIHRLVVTDLDGHPVLSIALRANLSDFNGSLTEGSLMESLNITLDWLGGIPLTKMPSSDSYALKWGSLSFAFGAVPHFKVGRARAEMVVIEGNSAWLTIVATGGEGPEVEQAAHLDFVLQLRGDRGACTGVLPELWGLRPLSNKTVAMLVD